MSNHTAGNTTKLRFGVMCNGMLFQEWQAKCIKELLSLENVEAALVVIDGNTPPPSDFGNKLINYSYRSFLYRAYKRFFLTFNSCRLTNLSALLKEVPVISCKTFLKGKHSQHFSEKDIETISGYHLDFILRFGFNIIRGEILTVSKYGIWSFHHNDEQQYRGGPPVFWEIYENKNVAGAILQKLTNKVDGGVVLKKGYFKTVKHSYKETLDQIFFDSASWPKQVCIDIQNGVSDYINALPSNSNAPIKRYPTNFQMLLFLPRLIKNKAYFHYNDLFCAEKWSIGIAKAPIHYFLKENFQPEITWLSPMKRGSFTADPFGFKQGEKIYLLFEEYTYKKGKAHISIAELDSDLRIKDTVTAIEKSSHLSYPFMIEHENEWYCLPENHEDKEIALYQPDQASGKWIKKYTLLKGIAAIDTTLFYYEKRWWLFCTDKETHSNLNLHLFYSDNFSGPYLPHKGNPVKTDIRSARPAGSLFIHNGNLYRPSQDCSKTYGGQINVNKILKLTPEEFKEETVKTVIPPEDTRFSKGIHTLSSLGEHTLIDVKRYEFSGAYFKKNMKKKLKKLFRINR